MARKGLNRKRGLESLIPQFNETIAESEERVAEKSKEKKNRETENSEKENLTVTEKVPVTSGDPSSQDALQSSEEQANSAGTAKQNNDDDSGEKKDGVVMIRLSLVVPNHDQPRKEFDEDAIAELTESIKQYGVLQPLLVQKKGRYYEIIAGERRWRASRAAGLKEVPCIVREFSRQETMEVSLIENIQREDLNPIEEAEAYKTLSDEFHLTQEEIARKVGRSRAAVTNSLRLLKLTPEVRQMVVAGDLSMGHARAILSIEDPDYQAAAASQVVEKQLSVRETEQLVKRILEPPKQRKKAGPDEQTALAYREAESRMQKKLGTRVSIHSRGKKGKIEIEYYSEEDLERIIDLLQ